MKVFLLKITVIRILAICENMSLPFRRVGGGDDAICAAHVTNALFKTQFFSIKIEVGDGTYRILKI